MLRLFRELNLRAVRRRPAATLAAVAAVAVGVAVIAAIDLANAAAESAFADAVAAVGGRATHEIQGGAAGVPEAAVLSAPKLPGVSAAAAVIEGVATPADDPRRPLFVFGIDLFAAGPFRPEGASFAPDRDAFERLLAEPATCVLKASTAAALGVAAGGAFDAACGGRRVRLTVVGTAPDAAFGGGREDRVVVDVATAQELFDRAGFVDRVDLILKDGADEAAVRTALPPGLTLSRPERRAGANAALVRSFRLNLLALSTLATFVGAYLAFNAAQYSVAVRRRAIAQARCFGATRADVRRAFLFEGALVGLLGGALGLLAGRLLAPLALDAVGKTASSLYAAVRPDDPRLGLGAALRALLIGVGSASLAAWFPARDAARISPRAALSRAPEEAGFGALRARLAVIAALGLLAGVVAPLVPTDDHRLGYVAIAGVLAAAAALAPLLGDGLCRGVAAVARRAERPGLHHAATALRRDLGRAGAAQAALAAALAMTLGIVTMVGSFRDTVTLWLEQALRADVYVGPARAAAPFDATAMPEDFLAEVAARPDVLRADALRGGPATLPDGARVFLAGVAAEDAAERWWFVGDPRREDVRRALADGACVVSESFARRRSISVGDAVELPARNGPRAFRVAAVFRDYSVDAGYVAVDLRAYAAAFGDVPARGVALTARPGVAPADLARDVQAAADGRYAVRARATADLKRDALSTFDRTFAVTAFLRGVAAVMAFLGVAVALFARAIERRKETATLRALGLTRRGAALLAAAQGALFTVPAAIAGAAAGLWVARLLADVVNARAFGWSLLWAPRPSDAAGLVAAAVAVGAVAAALPLRRTLREPPAAALREE